MSFFLFFGMGYFFDFFGRARLHGSQTRRVGGAWSNSDFLSNFFGSCCY